jgi:hypothetical protein
MGVLPTLLAEARRERGCSMTPTKMDAMTSGVFVSWDTKPTSHRRLHGALERLKLESMCPPPYSVGEALKRALVDYSQAHRKELVKDLDNKSNITIEVKRLENATEDGYEVVAVEHGKSRNSYPRLFSARVDTSNGSESVEVTDGWRYDVSLTEISSSYQANRVTVSASGVTKLLVTAVKLLNGTCVREVGGHYYCPDGCQDDWTMLCRAVEEENGTAITWHEIVMNESTARAIRKAVRKEVTTEVDSITEEINSGALGARAIDNRILRLRELMGKAHQYEGILSSPLDDVRKALEDAETAAATASMLASVKAEQESGVQR